MFFWVESRFRFCKKENCPDFVPEFQVLSLGVELVKRIGSQVK